MLTIECPDHRTRVLVPATRIRCLHHTGAGILLTVECWCGTLVTVHTGHRQPATEPAREAVSLSR